MCCSVQTFIALIFLLLLSNISVTNIHLKTPWGSQERGEGSKGFPARNCIVEGPIQQMHQTSSMHTHPALSTS